MLQSFKNNSKIRRRLNGTLKLMIDLMFIAALNRPPIINGCRFCGIRFCDCKIKGY